MHAKEGFQYAGGTSPQTKQPLDYQLVNSILNVGTSTLEVCLNMLEKKIVTWEKAQTQSSEKAAFGRKDTTDAKIFDKEEIIGFKDQDILRKELEISFGLCKRQGDEFNQGKVMN